jgi:putative endonuclease
MLEKTYWVYLMASRRNGTLYVGVTNHLGRRIWEHKNGHGSIFAAEHGVKGLVWYESHRDINEAIRREKQIKKWQRRWKLELIEAMNPNWRDLYEELNN